MTTLVRGGLVIGPVSAQPMDVLVDGEKVVALLAPGDSSLGADLAAGAERVIDATGKYVKKTITVEIKKGKSVTQMAATIKTKLDELLEAHWQFSYNVVGNSVTVWPTDSAADPDKEGSPSSSPADKDVDAKVRKETHPLKK